MESNLETNKDIYSTKIQELKSSLSTNQDEFKLKLDVHDQDFKRLQMEVKIPETEKKALTNTNKLCSRKKIYDLYRM